MHRRGFILFFGVKPVTRDEDGPRVRTRCPSCEQVADMVPRSCRHWFTLFFVPVFPIGPKMSFSQCSHCQTTFHVPPEQVKSRVDHVDDAARQRAIGMYNSLRASPGNSVTLNELMGLYAGLGEYDEAIGAAEMFPAALEASEQCMTTLGRVYLSKGDYRRAVEWFDRAIERNPLYADGPYFKAVALSTGPAPDLPGALAAARAARTAGHPAAEGLIRDIEQKMRQDG